MGINKQNKTQMKFATLFALVASASAIKLRTSQPKTFSLVLKEEEGWKCPSQADYNEAAEWVFDELSTGEKTITLKEGEKALKAHAKKNGYKISKDMWAQAKAGFDYVDADKNGELDFSEMKAAYEAHSDQFHTDCGLAEPPINWEELE